MEDCSRTEINISLMLSPSSMSGIFGIIFKFKLEFDIFFDPTLA